MSRFNPFATTNAPPSNEPEAISVADTAKLVRDALKRAFPDQKFGVRSKSYSGGASISVSWTDGPTTKEVEAITADYEGSGFDGMTDSKFYHTHWLLPDGTTQIHRLGDGQGRSEVLKPDAPAPGARRVHFRADSVHTSREYSPSFRALVIQAIDERHGPPFTEERLYEVKGSPVRGTDLLHQLSYAISALPSSSVGASPADSRHKSPSPPSDGGEGRGEVAIGNLKPPCPLATFKFLLEQEGLTTDPERTLAQFTTWLTAHPGDWRKHLAPFLESLKAPTVPATDHAIRITEHAPSVSAPSAPSHPIGNSQSAIGNSASNIVPVSFTAPPANEVIIRRESRTLRMLQERRNTRL